MDAEKCKQLDLIKTYLWNFTAPDTVINWDEIERLEDECRKVRRSHATTNHQQTEPDQV